MYEVFLERSTERDLNRLEADVYRRVIEAIVDLANNPRPPGSRKITGSQSDWRIRVGDYRVVYEIADDRREARVMRVRHRREVYR